MSRLPIGRPRFVSTEEAVGWHAVAIAEYGGSPGLRDAGLLDSALAAPRQAFGGEFAHAYPFGMAAAYAFHLAKNHPFVDGNKRVALLCCGAFLRMNGWDLVSEDDAAAHAILSLVSDELTKDQFAEWLLANTHERPSLELRDFFCAARWARLNDAMNASLSSPFPDEFRTTLNEATKALPLCGDLFEEANAAWERHDAKAHAVYTAQLSLLMHLFRLAEVMGYEW